MPARWAMHLPLRIGVAITLGLSICAAVSADISVPSSHSVPPQVEARDVRLLRGQRARLELRAHYGGGSAVHFEIVRRPAHGRLSEPRDLGDNRAVVTYTHDGSTQPATDSFSYIARAGGQASAAAEVRIKVDEPAPRLVVTNEIDFGEIMAGESATRQLAITNAGGGVLAGRVTASSPWRVAPVEYRIGAGATENLAIAFRPNEARKFVGQVTLVGDAGGTATVSLLGGASAPLRVEPSPVLLRSETVSLANKTDRALQLRFQTSPNLNPISELVLRAKGEEKLLIEVRPEVSGPIHENITIAGPGFVVPLPIDAPALEPKLKAVAATPVPRISPTSTATPSAAPPVVAAANPPAPAPIADRSPDTVLNSMIRITTHRKDLSHWELQWPVDQEHPEATYRVDERKLSLDKAGNLLTNWIGVSAKITSTRDRVRAQLGPLDPRQLHMLRVTALAPDGSVFWEAPLVALQPEPAQSHGYSLLLLALGTLLAVFLFFRWRA